MSKTCPTAPTAVWRDNFFVEKLVGFIGPYYKVVAALAYSSFWFEPLFISQPIAGLRIFVGLTPCTLIMIYALTKHAFTNFDRAFGKIWFPILILSTISAYVIVGLLWLIIELMKISGINTSILITVTLYIWMLTIYIWAYICLDKKANRQALRLRVVLKSTRRYAFLLFLVILGLFCSCISICAYTTTWNVQHLTDSHWTLLVSLFLIAVIDRYLLIPSK